MGFKKIDGRDLITDIMDYDVILIGTGTKNSLGNGFQKKVARSFPEVNKANKLTRYADPRKMGTVNVVEGCPVFCLCYIHNGRYRPDIYPDVVNYDALEKCLNTVNNLFKGKKVASTIIGHSPFEGGGDKEKCMGLMEKCLTEIDLTVYDYEQINFRDEDNHIYRGICEDRESGKITKDEYFQRKKEFLWQKHFGYFLPMPKGLTMSDLKRILLAKKRNILDFYRMKEEILGNDGNYPYLRNEIFKIKLQ